MAVAVANALLLTDGDAALLRVDNRRPAHALEPGVAASATNKRFDEGKPGPRFGCALDPWGIPAPLALGNYGSLSLGGPLILQTISGFVVGARYLFLPSANREVLAPPTATINYDGNTWPPTGATITRLETFVAETTTYQMITRDPNNPVSGVPDPLLPGTPIIATLARVGHTCAYKRFSDPVTDTDNGILLTDDWRDGGGEDGGRGRAWRILSGSVPQEIDLNGHDVWDTARLEQCHHAIALARHGNERHYFNAAAVTASPNVLTLNATPSWNAGDRVILQATTNDAAITASLIAITDTDLTAETLNCATGALTTGVRVTPTGITGVSGSYYVRVVSSGVISLYDTRDNAIAGGATGRFDVTVDDETGSLVKTPPKIATRYYVGTATTAATLFTDAALTNQLGWDIATGKFYLELDRDPKPFFGDGAPVLLLQPSLTQTAFEVGFVAAPTQVAITDTDAATDVLTAPNHRFAPGDSVVFAGTITGITAGTTYFAAPTSEHTFKLYDNAINALAAGATGLQNLGADDQTATIKKTSAAGLPLPPLRELAYIAGRLWGINGDDEVVFSDPFDFLHYTRFVSQVPANQGEAGQALWIRPLGEDVMCIGKEQKIIAIAGIGGATSTWKEGTITGEYGGIAALAAVPVGTDLQFASRKGWASIVRSIAGERLGVSRTISEAIPQDLRDIDWGQAGLMCAETWNGRLFWGVPTKGQLTPVNNKVLVLNRNNAQLYVEQQAMDGDIVGGVRVLDETTKGPDSWEGSWTGDLLVPYAFARLKVNGEERLTWATADGVVCWFHDGFDDAGAEIADELITRGYFGGREVLALKGLFKWETFRPKLSAYVRTAGYNEEEQLTGFDELEYDATKYLTDGTPDYVPATSTTETFDRPHREDYSPTADELLTARLDVHQSLSEPFRCRVRDRAIQLRIVNEQGSARICGVTLQAKPVGISATRKT